MMDKEEAERGVRGQLWLAVVPRHTRAVDSGDRILENILMEIEEDEWRDSIK